MKKPPYITVSFGMRGVYAVKLDPDSLEILDFGSRWFTSMYEAVAYAKRWAVREGLEYKE